MKFDFIRLVLPQDKLVNDIEQTGSNAGSC